MAREAIDLSAGVTRPANAGKPSGTAPQNRRHHRDRLDVVDRRRAAVEADLRREWRLQARLALLALQALEQRGLLAADVGAGAAMEVDVVVPPRPAGVLADQPGGIGFRSRERIASKLRRHLCPGLVFVTR